MLFLGLGTFAASPSFGAGATKNAIVVGGAPLGASVGGSFVPGATATSLDTVIPTLDPTSTGCSVSGVKVVFTSAGECVLNFNDPGNATYAPAPQITQDIKVYAANIITAGNAPTAGSINGFYSPTATATSGDVVKVTLASSSTGCTVSADKLTFTKQGTCRVILSDPGNGAFAAAKPVEQKVTIYTANILKTSKAPATGVINGAYQASASASSLDSVVVTLDPTSVGCEIVVQRVTFTGNGFCRIDFNDPGNGAFAPAKQVQQTITIGSGGPVAQATLYITSLNATKGKTLALTTGGGSGSGALAFGTTSGTANCSLHANVLSYSRVGTCAVWVRKSADVTYLSARSATAIVNVNLASSPRAMRVSTVAVAGRTVRATIVGTGFYGKPRIVSSVATTKVVFSSDNGRALVVYVTVPLRSATGVHTLTLTFAHGERTSVLYTQH